MGLVSDVYRKTSGVDTSTGDAVASDIRSTKKAWVNGLEITGTANISEIDSYTKVLLHMDGANTGTTFTDASGKAWTPVGTAQTSTTQKAYGTSSMLLDGDSDFIYTPASTDLNFGADPFTIEMWFYPTRSTGTGDMMYYFGEDINNRIYFYHTNSTVIFVVVVGGSNKANYQVSSGLTLNTWQHIAVARNGTNFYWFRNGVLQTPTVITAISTNACPSGGGATIGALSYGASDPSAYFGGYIDEVRISKGIARWTASFALGAPYPS